MDFIILFLASLLPTFAVQGTVAQTPSTQPATQDTVSRPAITATFAFGEVTVIKASEGQILIKTKEGDVSVTFDQQTEFKRLVPGAESLSAAEPIKLSDIGVGDVLMARGKVSADKQSVIAKQIIVMNKVAIEEKQSRDREKWRSNSFAGAVVAVNQQSREVTLTLRTPTGEQALTVEVPESAEIRRYASHSAKFSDAVPISLPDIKVADQLRVLGEKSQDGNRFTARQVVSGSFRILGGPIVQVDPAKSEIVINDVATQKPVTIEIKPHSTLRNVPAEVVASLGQNRTPASGAGGSPRANVDLLEIFDGLPAVTINDLKSGRMLLISAATTNDPSRFTALLLATGLDPLFSRPQPTSGQRRIVGAVGLPSGIFDGFIGNP